jgi:ribosome-binding protein aMBF1 (putative translation factor)
LAHWTFTQRSIHLVLGNKPSVLKRDKPFPATVHTLGDLIVASRKEAGLTQEKLAEMSEIHRQWIGRWERGRALPDAAAWARLQAILNLPEQSECP